MRINILGNILNWGMGFACLLREAGHEARVFINRRDMDFYQPSWEYPDFTPEKYPFVEFVDLAHWRVLAPGAKEKAFLARLADCDIIQTFGEEAWWAQLTGRPYAVLSPGFDLEVLAFSWGGPKALVRRALIRRAFARAGAFVYGFERHHGLVEKLGLKNAIYEPSAVPIDCRRYAPIPEDERSRLRKAWSQRWVFFHGARQEWSEENRDATNAKSNDWLFKAFARFVRDEPDSLLIAVRKGRDVARSQDLCATLGISDNIRWVAPMTKVDLIRTLNAVDGFCDQFSGGYVGTAALEALSCGVPVFTNLDPVYEEKVPLPPVQRCGTVEETYAALRHFASDPQSARTEGLAGREWVMRHHSWEASAARYGKIYQQCLKRA